MTEEQDNGASSEQRDRSGRRRRLLGHPRRLAPIRFVALGVLLTLVVYRSLDSEPETITKSEVEEGVTGALESIAAFGYTRSATVRQRRRRSTVRRDICAVSRSAEGLVGAFVAAGAASDEG